MQSSLIKANVSLGIPCMNQLNMWNFLKESEPRKTRKSDFCLCVCVCVFIYLYTYIYTCKRCLESGGSPAPAPSLQRRKRPWVQEMTAPSAGGRKAEEEQMSSHIHRFRQMTKKFIAPAAPWRGWLQPVDPSFGDC